MDDGISGEIELEILCFSNEAESTKVIKNDSVFLEFFNSTRCVPEENMPDFNKYSVLVNRKCGACDVGFAKHVEFDHENKTVVYRVDIDECGICESMTCKENVVVVPKIPDDYEVVFK